MKLTWNEVKPYFEEETVWVHRQEMYWYQYVWQLLDESNLTVYNSRVEKLAVYSRIYAIIKIYRDFCNIAFGESSEFSLYLDELSDEEGKQDIYGELIKDSDTMRTIFDLLKMKLGVDHTYCSLWITCCPENLETGLGTYENYTDVLSKIMNEVSIDKLASYEWLANQM